MLIIRSIHRIFLGLGLLSIVGLSMAAATSSGKGDLLSQCAKARSQFMYTISRAQQGRIPVGKLQEVIDSNVHLLRVIGGLQQKDQVRYEQFRREMGVFLSILRREQRNHFSPRTDRAIEFSPATSSPAPSEVAPAAATSSGYFGWLWGSR